MNRVRKDDMVYVLAGKDKGKTGKVLFVYPDEDRALVEGINFVKRHTRITKTQDQQMGGIVQKESPIHISNLAIFCKGCKGPTKTGISKLSDGSNVRICKKCNETL